MSRRIISLLLAILLIIMSMGLPVGAEESQPELGALGSYPIQVTATAVGDGTGSIVGAGTYPSGTAVTLSATADPDSVFVKWQVKLGGEWTDRTTNSSFTTVPLYLNMKYRAIFNLKPIVPLTVTFDQAHSVPGGQFRWIVHNPNDFNVLYTYALSTSEGPEEPMSKMRTALPGDNEILRACLDLTVERIDTLRIIWGFGPAYADLSAPEDAAEFCPPKPTPPPSATAQSVPWYVLTASATHGDIQDAGMTTVIPTTNHWAGTILSLTAVPIEQSMFDGWSGDLSGVENPKNLTMNADKTIEALFDLKDYVLTLTTKGDGSGQVDGEGTFPAYSTPAITASPDPGSRFEGWYHGDTRVTQGNGYTLPALMQDETYTANFLRYGIGFQKMIRLPLAEETIIPEDGQFTFRLQALEPKANVQALSLDDFQLPPVPYDQTASNDEDGWVQFWSNPELRMFLTPGYYLLTETPEEGYSPCTIPPGGLVLKLKWSGRFYVVGPFVQPAISSMMASANDDGPDYCGQQEAFVVYNCENPAPGLAIDKKANTRCLTIRRHSRLREPMRTPRRQPGSGC